MKTVIITGSAGGLGFNRRNFFDDNQKLLTDNKKNS